MSIIEFIRDRARYYNCPVCGRTLRGCDVRMLSSEDDRFTVQVTCAACDVTFIMILAVQGTGLEALAESQIEIEVDHEPQLPVVAEIAECRGAAVRGPIELDELLDLHLMLRDFSGPLVNLVRQGQKLPR